MKHSYRLWLTVAAIGLVSITSISSTQAVQKLSDLAPVSRVEFEQRLGAKDYNASHTYKLNEIVRESGKLYRANTAITTPEAFNVAKWDLLVDDSFQGMYQSSTAYTTDQIIVGTNNIIYRVTADFTSTAGPITDAANQTNLQALGSQNGTINYDPTISYVVGDIVAFNGEFFRCTTNTTGTVSSPEIFDTGKWEDHRLSIHTSVADQTALLAIASPRTNDTAFQQDSQLLYRHNGGSAGTIADWTLIYDFSAKVDQTEFDQRLGAKDFNAAVDYKQNELVVESGILYRANAAVSAGAFNAANFDVLVNFDSLIPISTWDVATNTPAIPAASASNQKHYYIVSVAGTSSITGASEDYVPGDILINMDGANWVRIANTQDYASQAEAEAGTENTKVMTALRVSQAVTEYGQTEFNSVADQTALLALANQVKGYLAYQQDTSELYVHNGGSAGTIADWDLIMDNTNLPIASQAEAEDTNTGTALNTVVMTPLRTLQSILKNHLTNIFALRDNTDETKQVQFNLSGLTTGTTRNLTVPDRDLTIAGEDQVGISNYSAAATYVLNQLVKQDGLVYRNTTPITAGEAFNATKWELVTTGGSAWESISAAQTLTAFSRYIVDTSGGSFILTLPATPAIGDEIIIKDAGSFGTNSVTVARNGNTILGVADDIEIDVENAHVRFVFTTTGNWGVDHGATFKFP